MKRSAWEDNDDALRGWRPDIDGASLPPKKRARVEATAALYTQLRSAVFTALRERATRDKEERAKSRDLAERFPLSFPCPDRSVPHELEPTVVLPATPQITFSAARADSLSCKSTPALTPLKSNNALGASLVSLDLHSPAPVCVAQPGALPSHNLKSGALGSRVAIP